MRSREPIGYVVQVEGTEVTLNLLDLHRGQLASHAFGVSSVTEVGCLLGVAAGDRVLVMRVLSLAFAEPREAHKLGVGSSAHQTEPLRNLTGVVVGRLQRDGEVIRFITDSLLTPPLGADAFPLSREEVAATLGQADCVGPRVVLGEDLRGGGQLALGAETLLSRHVAVLGASGQGKSCFTAAILQQLVRLKHARIVVFDVNGEYEDALRLADLPEDAVSVTTLGREGVNAYRIPYYALGRYGLHRLLLPSEKTQRPALSFALERLKDVVWVEKDGGAGLVGDKKAVFFDDCRQTGAAEASAKLDKLRKGEAKQATTWPHMLALAALVAESSAIQAGKNGPERNAFTYGYVSPLVTRIRRLVDDAMFCEVVDISGGGNKAGPLSWQTESERLVEKVFGGEQVPWRAHVVNLRRVSHDLMPFVLGSLLELYAYVLFRKGQEKKVPTLLVLEEAHHYMRSIGSGEDASANALAYERLAKEGRKFGVALWLSTQRPSEVSATVLSQCSNWVTFRLTAEKDLATVQAASEWADRRDIRRIAGLARQTALVFGGGLAMPTLIRAPLANPLPRSEDGAFRNWGG